MVVCTFSYDTSALCILLGTKLNFSRNRVVLGISFACDDKISLPHPHPPGLCIGFEFGGELFNTLTVQGDFRYSDIGEIMPKTEKHFRYSWGVPLDITLAS